MKRKQYVWVIGGDISSNKVFSHLAQVRLFAKEKGFSIFDETYTKPDLIIFSRKENWTEKSFYATRYELI